MKEEQLKIRWAELTKNYTESFALTDDIYVKLLAHYTSGHRHYHTLEHISFMLTTIEAYKSEIEEYDAVCFAIWFHDVIYNPLKSDNEVRSAEYALQALKPLNIPTSILTKIQSMILATANHMDRLENETFDTQIFLDSDLRIIGSPRNEYIRYMEQIRKEYTWIPDMVYKPGRKNVLRKFLQSEYIYRTRAFRSLYDQQAKENILFELEQL